MNRVIRESEPEECPFCLYGEIPAEAELPYPLCAKHMDVITFVWDKAGIPWWIEDIILMGK